MAKPEETVKNQLNAIQYRYGSEKKPTHDGGELESRYKPDRVYDVGGNLLIIEIETTTSRKGLLGNYVKAHKYFDCSDKKGGLLIIMKEHDNTTLENIHNQLSPYHKWITNLGAKEISVQIITIAELDSAVDNGTGLFNPEFKRLGRTLK